jgi:small neutral amino acid transporter SnatA (MarC family)
MTETFVKTATLLFVLLNPFLLAVYLQDLMTQLPAATFRRVLLRGCLIAGSVFAVFAVTGDAIFKELLQVRFASFLIFGGLLFLLIGIRFALVGQRAVSQLRGSPEHVAGSIAMPFMVGPGTVSAAILAGAHLPLAWALGAIATGLLATVVCVFVLKAIYDHVATKNQSLTSRYVDIIGRISAFVIGTIAVEMILRGIETWMAQIG